MRSEETSEVRGAARTYGPLVAVAASLALVLLALPSALNVRQASVSQTLEYAPVPDQGQSSEQDGNLSSLGLGSSGLGVDAGRPPPSVATPRPRPGQDPVPSSKQCVGDPPRQSEDPLAPPCVAVFRADNGGATASGVTADEVRILVYVDGGGTETPTSRGSEPRPSGVLVDLSDPPSEQDNHWVRMFRLAQRHFNNRYQTYNRTVRFWIYFNDGTNTPESVQREAADNLSRVKPFAVLNYEGYMPDPYNAYMAQRRVPVFVGSHFSSIGSSERYFRRFPKLLWSYTPTLEERASLFSTMVCDQVAGRAVSFSGNPTDLGRQRNLALIRYQVESSQPQLAEMGRLIQAGIEGCGVRFESVQPIQEPHCSPGPGQAAAARGASGPMADLRQRQVTTIIVAGGTPCGEARAADSLGWFPEWVAAGDGIVDETLRGTLLPQSQWRNAFLQTIYVRRGPPEADHCFQAAKDADPAANEFDVTNWYCTWYPTIQQLFTGIQVAGPRLSAETMDQGFHAIPDGPSGDPRVPACFYRTGDYACVKDAMIEWWDPSGRDPSSESGGGCYRMTEGGRRFLSGTWPKVEISSRRSSSDICNAQFGF